MLKAENLNKSYDHLQILKGIQFEVKQGEMVSIVGSSGAGKTTLLQVLGTLDKPDSGTVLIDGVNPFTLSSSSLAAFRNQNIGFIFQFHQLLPEFTAVENIALPAMIKGLSLKDAKRDAYRLLEGLGLELRAEHKPNELSGGEQQRVAALRALINKPKIILADEPTGNLDSQNSFDLYALFKQLREQFGQTFIIVTHNHELADLADRKLIMRDGMLNQA